MLRVLAVGANSPTTRMGMEAMPAVVRRAVVAVGTAVLPGTAQRVIARAATAQQATARRRLILLPQA